MFNFTYSSTTNNKGIIYNLPFEFLSTNYLLYDLQRILVFNLFILESSLKCNFKLIIAFDKKGESTRRNSIQWLNELEKIGSNISLVTRNRLLEN